MPSASTLEHGEIAVNYHKNTESLFIKNDDGEVKTFRSDNQLPPVEKHENQEFVYRQAVNENEAKSLELTRIYGKTLAWNQMEYNGNFSNGTDSWIAIHGTMSISDNEITVTVRSAFTPTTPLLETTPDVGQIVGHKYYFRCEYYLPSTNVELSQINLGLRGTPIIYCTVKDTWTKAAKIQTSSNSRAVFVCTLNSSVSSSAVGDYAKLRNINVFDLTLLGIDNLTTEADVEEWLEKNVGARAYYDYTSGKLISNDAESIETVGFNQWDEQWENGYINENGENVSSSAYIRSTNYIPVIGNTSYHFRMPTSQARVYAYDSSENLISIVGWKKPFEASFITPGECKYIRFWCDSGYGTTYNHDICINLSDPAKNGTYEPYRKSTMQLGLNNLKVKSHNIWDEEWAQGSRDQQNGMIDPTYAGTWITNKNLIPVFTSASYYIYCSIAPTTDGFYLFYYDKEGNFLNRDSQYWNAPSTQFNVPDGCYYIAFSYRKSTYDCQICINVSSSFNGQYEPYGNITVNGGLKSAGDVKDEIVGNKYIKRVGSFKIGDEQLDRYQYGSTWTFRITKTHAATNNTINVKYGIFNGTSAANMNDGSIMTKANQDRIYFRDDSYSTAEAFKTANEDLEVYYELATPIEYTLVSPLVPIVKAGTTEARISPNSDGLSAPMVCDMQYTMDNDYVVGEFNSKLGDIQTILQTI